VIPASRFPFDALETAAEQFKLLGRIYNSITPPHVQVDYEASVRDIIRWLENRLDQANQGAATPPSPGPR
jgi:hypothetical protein